MSMIKENYQLENPDLYKYRCNTNVLVDRRHLKFIAGTITKKFETVPNDSALWYPAVNAYYRHAEHYDAVNRVAHLLHDLKDNYCELFDTKFKHFAIFKDSSLEHKSLHNVLRQKPMCFLMLGKPEMGEQQLGKMLAEYWRCVYVHPESLIQEEINSGSRTGMCIEFNLRCGRAISVDVIMRLLEKRIRCPSVQHRGFVICGFPLIANDLYAEDPVSSESAIFHVHEIFDDLLDTTIHIISPVEEIKNVSRTSATEIVQDSTPSVENVNKKTSVSTISQKTEICYQSDYLTDNNEQMKFIFNLCKDHTYTIIYLTATNEDVVNTRLQNRFNTVTSEIINLQTDNALAFQENDYFGRKIQTPKLLNLQRNLPVHVRVQLEAFLLHSEFVIEKNILLHDPQYIIRLDGRMPPYRMYHTLKTHLKIFPYLPVLIPESLHDPPLLEELGESPRTDFTDTNLVDLSPEESFRSLLTKKTVGPLYKWSLSDWVYSCPVAMAEGRNISGKTEFAMQFMNKIFFLSDEKAKNKFIENPRPYLLPPFPRNICRIFVIGPRSCGKSAVAQCISYLMNLEILVPKKLIMEYLKKSRSDQMKKVKEEARIEGLEILKERRKTLYLSGENERLEKVGNFVEKIKEDIKKYLECNDIVTGFQEVELTSLPSPRFNEKPLHIMEASRIMEQLSKEFAESNIPVDDIDALKNILEKEEFNEDFLPEDLQAPLEYTFSLVAPDHPFVVQYLEEAIKKREEALQPDSLDIDDLVTSFKTGIDAVEEKIALTQSSGWVIDDFPVNIALIEKLKNEKFGNLIYILRDKSDGTFLKKQFRTKQGAKRFNFHDFFFENDNEYIADLISESEENFNLYEGIESTTKEDIIEYEESLQKFNLDCDNLIEYLREQLFPFKIFSVTWKNIKDVLLEVMEDIQARFSQKAYLFTPEDRIEEVNDYGEPHAGDEELGGEDFDPNEDGHKLFLENRRLGNSNVYCPVTLKKYDVLWKGKEEYAAKFKNKLYFFNSEESLNVFLLEPMQYCSYVNSMQRLLPPRICITGINKIGKTTLAKSLSKQLGLYYGDFEHLLKQSDETFDIDGYLENDTPIPEEILKSIILPFWFEEPKKSIGFVLDGFPKRPSDITFMCKYCTIPDIVVELSCPEYELNSRLLHILLDEWQIQMDQSKAREEEANRLILETWTNERNIRRNELLEEKKEERYAKHYNSEEEEGDPTSFKSADEAEDLKYIEDILNYEFPNPIVNENWETVEMATERIQNVLEETNKEELNFITLLHENCANEQIPWIPIDASLQLDKVYYQALLQIMPIKFRNQSFLERIYDISLDLAEKLLQQGYYLISRFGKMCPVQIYEKINFMHMFLPNESKFQLFPVIYGNYIYFLCGLENKAKFKNDVLKYVNQENSPFPIIQQRIAIIGPPRSGKTTICERIEYEYGLKHISIGKSIRYVLKYLPNSKLYREVEEVLRKGERLGEDLAMLCVEAMAFDHKAVALGYVMDGFPNNSNQVHKLAELNMVPYLVINMNTTLSYIHEYMDVYRTDKREEYSKLFIANRFYYWKLSWNVFESWMAEEYQNVEYVNVEPSKWKVWTNVNKIILEADSRIKYYYKYVGKDLALRLSNMLVTPLEFTERMSNFKAYCTCCLQINNSLSFGGNPPNVSGLVQYLNKYYWICPEHLEDFMYSPQSFIGTNVLHDLPAILPMQVHLDERPDNVYGSGFCVVCIQDNKPNRVFNEGVIEHAILYGDYYYLFDTAQCLHKFMSKPNKYLDTNVNFKGVNYPPLDIKSLPTLGLLEQFDAGLLTKALINTNSLRPLVCGLSISTSALINIGLELKLRNPKTPEKYLPHYSEAKEKLETRRQLLEDSLAVMKKHINPYLYYEEPLEEFQLELFKKDSAESFNSKSGEKCCKVPSVQFIIEEILNEIDY